MFSAWRKGWKFPGIKALKQLTWCSLCGHLFLVSGVHSMNYLRKWVWHSMLMFKVLHARRKQCIFKVAFRLLWDMPMILCYSFFQGIWVIQEFESCFEPFVLHQGAAKLNNVTTSTDVHSCIHDIRHNHQQSPQPSLWLSSPCFAQLFPKQSSCFWSPGPKCRKSPAKSRRITAGPLHLWCHHCDVDVSINGGYPQSSSIYRWDFPWFSLRKQPILPNWGGTPINGPPRCGDHPYWLTMTFGPWPKGLDPLTGMNCLGCQLVRWNWHSLLLISDSRSVTSSCRML